MVVDTVHHANPRIHHHGSFDALPDALHHGDKRVRGRLGVEVKIDDDELWVVDGPKDAVTADASRFAPRWVAVKRCSPSVEVADGVLDLDCKYVDS